MTEKAGTRNMSLTMALTLVSRSQQRQVRWYTRFHPGHKCVSLSAVSCYSWRTWKIFLGSCYSQLPSVREQSEWKVKNTFESLGLTGSDHAIWEQASYFISSDSSSNRYLLRVIWGSQRKKGEQKKKTNDMQGNNCGFRNHRS